MNDPFTEWRPLLFSVAYRMTGSRADSEDILQDAFLRWQTVNQAEVGSPKAFLITTVSRLSLDTLKAAYRKRELYVGPWLPEPLTGPSAEPSELAESLSFAFLHLLESLPANERVAFLMREVFDSTYQEVAETLETTVANARQLVSRARDHLHARRPKRKVDPARHQQLLTEFMRACAAGDATALFGLLKQDAILYADGGGKTRSALEPIYRSDKIVRFVQGLLKKGLGDLGGYPLEVNGEAGAMVTLDGRPYALVSIQTDEDAIQTVFYVLNPEKFPPALPASS